jgi:hypothetical protein
LFILFRKDSPSMLKDSQSFYCFKNFVSDIVSPDSSGILFLLSLSRER